MWPWPWTHVGTPSHLGHMDRLAATMPSQAHAGAAQEAPDIGQWEGQDVPLVRPSSCNVKGGIPRSRRYLPTYLAVCHAVWHNNAVATVRSYFRSVTPMFKRCYRHPTICNPSEAKTSVLAVSPAQLHCLTRCPRYSNIGQYCVNRTCMALHTAYRRGLRRFTECASPRE